jgi:hypothetical protein
MVKASARKFALVSPTALMEPSVVRSVAPFVRPGLGRSDRIEEIGRVVRGAVDVARDLPPSLGRWIGRAEQLQ